MTSRTNITTTHQINTASELRMDIPTKGRKTSQVIVQMGSSRSMCWRQLLISGMNGRANQR